MRAGDIIGLAMLLTACAPHAGIGSDRVQVQSGDVYVILHQEAARAVLKRLEECR